MANELNISLGDTGQAVTASTYLAGALSTSGIVCSEVAGQGGYYSGNMTGATGFYDVQFFANGAIVGSGNIAWNGASELNDATDFSAAKNASIPTVIQVRQEMDANSTKLANLDATVSSRLAAAAYTAAPTVIQVRQEMDTNSTKLANLDATVSSRLAAAAYTAAPTVIQVRQEMDANSTKLANLDATVSSRLATSGYTTPPTSAAIAAATAAVLFVDGSTNTLKVNADHSVNSSGGGGGTIVNYITIPPAVAAASQDPSVITCVRGDTLRISLPLMGDLANRTKLVMTAKANVNDTDTQAVFQVVEGTGLTRLNGSGLVTAGTASLTVTNASTGATALVIDPTTTAALAVRDLVWDVQATQSTGITTPIGGTFAVVADVTQAVT